MGALTFLLAGTGCVGDAKLDPDGGPFEGPDGSSWTDGGTGHGHEDGGGSGADGSLPPGDGGSTADGGGGVPDSGGGPVWPGGATPSASALPGTFGGLSATQWAPEGLDDWGLAPLVLVLHGMGQSADAIVGDSDWPVLAGEHGFYLVAAQKPGSGPFDWFGAGRERGAAEPEGLVAMVNAMAAEHSVDRDRVFVTGLSAGAFMAVAVCAGYPDVYAGCGSFAGGPYGCGMGCMSAPETAAATPLPAMWLEPGLRRPSLFLVHGRTDGIVAFSNLDAATRQWTRAHGIDTTPDNASLGLAGDLGGHAFDVHAEGGRAVVATLAVDGMGHGVPIAPGDGEGQGGQPSMFSFDVGVYGAYEMIRFWGLAP